MYKIIEMTLDEWLKMGKELFGEDQFKWKFACPSCGHIQTPRDFEQYKDQGATPNSAYFNCIGRYSGEGGEMCGGKRPCNYTSGGLINISPILVVHEDGKKTSAFAFAKSAIK